MQCLAVSFGCVRLDLLRTWIERNMCSTLIKEFDFLHPGTSGMLASTTQFQRAHWTAALANLAIRVWVCLY